MPKIHEGEQSVGGRNFGIVVSRFNEPVTSLLLDGALRCLEEAGADMEAVEVVWVPGAFEIAGMAASMLSTGRFDGIICLGAVIRGETPHFDYVSAEVARGVGQLAAQGRVPVIFGVLTTDDADQAFDRAGTDSKNKGREAALAAMEMADLYARFA